MNAQIISMCRFRILIHSLLLSSSLHGYAVQTVHFTHQRPPRFSARNLPRRIRESTASGLM